MTGSLSMMMAGGVAFPLTAANVSDSNFAAASAGYYLRASGLVDTSTLAGGTINQGLWATGSFSGSAYEAVVTPTSGTMSSGTTGSAVNLGSDQTWTVTQVGAGAKSCTANVVIRLAGGGATVASSTVLLTAQAMETP